jgi:aspartate kinase
VAYSKNDARVTLSRLPDKPGIASQLFNRIGAANIIVDMIIQNTSLDGLADITFTVPKGDLKGTLDIVKPLLEELGGGQISSDEHIAKVSIVGVGMRNNAGVAARMFSSLAAENINIIMISTSEIKVSCVINEKYTELAVRTLHDAFGLEQARPRGELK